MIRRTSPRGVQTITIMSSSTPTDCDEPFLLIVLPFVLARKVGALKDLYCTAEVQATLLQSFLTFSLVKLVNSPKLKTI